MHVKSPLVAACLFVFAVAGIGARAGDAPAEKFGPWRVTKAGMRAEWKINADYPVFDRPDIDNHIKAWLTAHSASFMDDVKDSADADIPEMLLDMKIDYTIITAASGAVTVLFSSSSDSNHAAHPSTRLNTLCFSPKGSLLLLDSLFEKPDRALEIFGKEAPKLIKEYYADQKEDLEGLDDWIAEGTAAKRDNYGCYAVESDGLRIYFQQYQVAPYSMGMPGILIPLSALAPAGPNAEVWPGR